MFMLDLPNFNKGEDIILTPLQKILFIYTLLSFKIQSKK